MVSNSQVQTLKQHLKVNPQQIQFLNFLNLGLDELDDYIKKELEENPFLEENEPGFDDSKTDSTDTFDRNDDTNDDNTSSSASEIEWETHFSPEEYDYGVPQYKTKVNNFPEDDEHYTTPITVEYTFRDEAKEQTHYLNFSEKEIMIAEFIIDMLDDTGFLRRDITDLTDDISFSYNIFVSEEEVAKVRTIINQLENGLAAVDLRECLLLQLEEHKRKGKDVEIAYKVLSECYHHFSERKFEKIESKLDITQDDIKKAITLIATLSPSPVRGKNSSTVATNHTIIPDYIIDIVDDQVIGEINNPQARKFGVNEYYANSLSNHKDKQTRSYVGNKIKSAVWFIDAIQQRKQTMTKVIETLVYLQEPYLKTGKVENLRPMILKNVADLIGMEISTVSRVTSKKYAQTPYGMINLKDLFTDSIMNNDGTEISNRRVKEMVKSIIDTEDKQQPYTDTQIKTVLQKEGISLSRRTITKYREAMSIDASKYRRVL
ncbi:MAG: RNA polymerase factor sigma-54 [Spirosomataceae bacterium]